MTLKEIESATKRNVLDIIKEAVKSGNYNFTDKENDQAIVVDGINICIWKTAYYVRIIDSIVIGVEKWDDVATDEDREIHNILLGLGDADSIKQNIEKKEMEIAELRKTLEKVTATA